jgi:hypothetical protein
MACDADADALLSPPPSAQRPHPPLRDASALLVSPPAASPPRRSASPSPQRTTHLALPGPAAAYAAGAPLALRAEAEPSAVSHHAAAPAAAPHLFASASWAAGVRHVAGADVAWAVGNAAFAPGAGALGSGGADPPDLRVPSLLVAVAALRSTPFGDGVACLADPSGCVDALFAADALESQFQRCENADAHLQPTPRGGPTRFHVAEGAVLLLRGATLLAPAAEPRRRALVVTRAAIAAAWPPPPPGGQQQARLQAPRRPLALPPAPPPQAPQHQEPVVIAPAPQVAPQAQTAPCADDLSALAVPDDEDEDLL